mmetsp:Transcript_47197/g.131774  ORF Transcript_47197/g.131774 Transcript_47197/m.131774 type:complete len:273 (-) Transcript_47197:464-1282(-)
MWRHDTHQDHAGEPEQEVAENLARRTLDVADVKIIALITHDLLNDAREAPLAAALYHQGSHVVPNCDDLAALATKLSEKALVPDELAMDYADSLARPLHVAQSEEHVENPHVGFLAADARIRENDHPPCRHGAHLREVLGPVHFATAHNDGRTLEVDLALLQLRLDFGLRLVAKNRDDAATSAFGRTTQLLNQDRHARPRPQDDEVATLDDRQGSRAKARQRVFEARRNHRHEQREEEHAAARHSNADQPPDHRVRGPTAVRRRDPAPCRPK